MGWVGKLKAVLPAIRAQTVVPQWTHRPCEAPTWFTGSAKKPSVKADLAIYSHVVDVPWGLSLILGFNLEFSSYDDSVGFHKSSHICKTLLEIYI